MKRTRILLLAVLLLLTSCQGERGPAGPAALPVQIIGEIRISAIYDPMADLIVAGTPSIPEANINGLACLRAWEPSITSQFLFELYDVPVAPGDSVHLTVDYARSDGNPAQARVDMLMPGPFTYTMAAPEDTITFHRGEDLAFAWTQPPGAEGVTAQCQIFYTYLDSSGWYGNWDYFYSGWLTDTTLVLPAAEIFPDSIGSLVWTSGYFVVSACGGPREEDDPDNVTGDGCGRFQAWTSLPRIFLKPVE
ncbi:MAG: hypothetical protein C4524_08200 [Candidatus Zixiibacteriota bacterium]|nr:MAG: hypothetical protein C4524_08200 [candidate division Zixibacteria bacterium]